MTSDSEEGEGKKVPKDDGELQVPSTGHGAVKSHVPINHCLHNCIAIDDEERKEKTHAPINDCVHDCIAIDDEESITQNFSEYD